MAKRVRLTEQRWKIWRGSLRPHISSLQVMEVQTVSGETVIPWVGFDAMSGSLTVRLQIARSIVRDHNAEINRANNMRHVIESKFRL